MFFGVGVSCRMLYSFVGYLYVNGSGSIFSVGEERPNYIILCYYLLVIMWFLLKRFTLLLGARDGLRYLLWHTLNLPYNYFVYYFSVDCVKLSVSKSTPMNIIWVEGGQDFSNASSNPQCSKISSDP